MAALLGLFWRLLREGRLKVARGRSWQPEIGMEHASRGRRSGNKGVGARWRGRFRIFSARHCSRTKVSHAENSGMTMLFARRRIPPALRLRCREATARKGHCGGAVGFVLEVVAGGAVESCEGEVVAARDWHGACLPGSALEIRARGKFRNDDVVFFFGGCSGVGGEFFHTLWRGRHEGVWFFGGRCCRLF